MSLWEDTLSRLPTFSHQDQLPASFYTENAHFPSPEWRHFIMVVTEQSNSLSQEIPFRGRDFA